MTTTRRAFIIKTALAASGLTLGLKTSAQARFPRSIPDTSNKALPKISIFSKHLHWLNYRDMAAAAAEMGFDGVDLTVRPSGHVLPEKVKEDLPKAVGEIRKAGLRVDMITTAIGTASEPFAEDILATAASLGISSYRLGWFKYDKQLSVFQNLDEFRKRLTDLQRLNAKYKIRGDYQNHAGDSFGSAVVDLWYVLKDLDPRWIGCQYDIRHASVEGANSWPIGLELISKYIGTANIKDYKWTQANGQWKAENVPLGEGMVDFKAYIAALDKKIRIIPVSMHYEYPLGGAEYGATKLSVAPELVFSSMTRDLSRLKEWLAG